MKKRWIWLTVAGLAVIAVTFYFRSDIMALVGGQQESGVSTAQARGGRPDAEDLTTTTIRPATDSAQVSAAGNIAIANQLPAVLQVEGIITELAVEVGDRVSAGDLLVALDTADLERAVQRAELELDASRAQLDKLLEPADPAEIAAARAKIASARENQADVQAGPTITELAAAEAGLSASQQRYQELLDGLSAAELTELSVEFHKTSIVLQQAQEAYNEIAYRGDIGSTQQAMDLQNATIDYEAAKAAYEVATEPASQADLQDVLKDIRDAESQLETLRNQPSQADLAEAEANVIVAEADLASMLNGATESEVTEAELNVQQAQLDLEEAEAQLAKARVRAPISGTILTVDVEPGQQISSGLTAITLADLTDLELTVNVAEVDISKVREGQPANITIDALPDRVFSGLVSRLAPASDSEGGVVNYPVTIQLDNLNLADVRPGMTAVTTISDGTASPDWLVPTDALREFEGETTVRVVRNGQPTRVSVVPGASQGEWTVVQSSELKSGDEVVGEVSSFLDEDGSGGFRGGPFGGRPRN